MFSAKNISFAFVLFLSCQTLFALENPVTLLDSVGIQRQGDKTFIIHKVEPKETLFGISRRYQTPVGEIVEANDVLKSGLKIGQQIRIPYISKATLPEGASLHKVAPGETLFAISKKYGVSVGELMDWNQLKGNDLSVGQALLIQKAQVEPENTVAELKPDENKSTEVQTVNAPEKTGKVNNTEKVVEPKKAEEKVDVARKEEEVKRPVAESKSSPVQASSEPLVPGNWISHEVKSGETLFSISSQYGAKVEDLINWNGLSSNNLRNGQVLKVGRAEVGAAKVPVIGEPKIVSSPGEMYVVPDGASSGGFKNIRETGQAQLIEGTGGHKKYLVLHRTAPVGSIIRVKNEQNDITIFARVVGTLPETGDNEKILIKLSQAAYDQLKAVNDRFPVEVLY
ncbi:LysM peptidoglycan-binding domain-containing protein [Algoriphagus sp. CAU 1675]|uniref:LysM peptidoglycan-binding domain-containing protein n=1 Tax=Algoriphagus sp. CAU 1675 TaxID=3032597 RepID=UPI0023DBDF66|nr:LysM peptidoglycan-binding domain-containing protein [Algoriphagus sp. CAU 1675]MDF2159357.1 LysM peptidoglycan-binding domain-containing protein [Algoriphagus sp. CAU 1675]